VLHPVALRAKLREGAYSNRESSGKGLTVTGKAQGRGLQYKGKV